MVVKKDAFHNIMQPTSSVHIIAAIKMLKVFSNFLLQETGSYIKIPNSTTKFPHECGVQLGLKRDIRVDPIGRYLRFEIRPQHFLQFDRCVALRRWNSPLLKEN